jgi:hypothetical protein
MLDQFPKAFAWHKGELGCCKYGEHIVDIQRFLPYRTTPSKLSFWEEAEVKKQIDALVVLRKMKPNTLDYACKVTLSMKKDGIH